MGVDTDDIDELFFKELREIARSTALVLMGDRCYRTVNQTLSGNSRKLIQRGSGDS